MRNMDNQGISSIQAEDRSFGERNEKRMAPNPKSTKYRQDFKRMSVKDLVNMNGDSDEGNDYMEVYETSQTA